MNLRRVEILVFVLLGLGALGFLLWTNRGEDQVDRYTGRVLVELEEALKQARRAGGARPAIEVLRERRNKVEEPAAIDRAIAVLLAEIADEGARPPEKHPARDAILAARERRAQAQEALDEQLDAPLPAAEVARILGVIAADDEVAAATEAFFRNGNGDVVGPDADAQRVLAKAAEAQRSPTAVEARTVALAFMEAGRLRAWLRWLRRAFAADPTDVRNVQPLAAALVAAQRQKEALLVVSAQEAPADAAVLQLRAQVATWLGRLRVEASALQALLAVQEYAGKRDRLIEVLRVLGRSADAVPYAKARAAADPTRANQESAVALALEGGLLDEALAILEGLAAGETDTRAWRERIVRVALNDLRQDRAIQELQVLVREHPDGRFTDEEEGQAYADVLQGLLRARGRDVQLLELLKQRLAGELTPEQRRATEDEVLFLAEQLSRPDEAIAVLRARLERTSTAEAYIRSFFDFDAVKLPGHIEKGVALLEAPETPRQRMRELYQLLEKRLTEARRRGILERLLARMPDDPFLETRLMLLLDAIDPEASAARLEARARAKPDDAALTSLWVQRASWIEDLEQQVRAREALRALVPDDLNNVRMLADIYEALQRKEDALAAWRFLAEQAGEGTDIEGRFVAALLGNERYEEALEIARRRAAAETADETDALQLLTVLIALRRWEEALPILRDRALRPDPDPGDRERYLEVLLAADRFLEALPLLKERAEAEGATDDDRERYIDVLLAAEQYEEVVPFLRERADRSREDELRYLHVLQALDRRDEVLEVLRRRADGPGGTWDDRFVYAETLLGVERQDDALVQYEKLEAERPGDPRVLRRLAEVRTWTGDPERALEPARALLARPYDAEDEAALRERAVLSFLVGEAYTVLEREREAHAAYCRAITLFEQGGALSPRERRSYALALARVGRIDSAGVVFEALVEEDPEDLSLRLDHADAYVNAKRTLQARRILEAARPLDEDAPRLWRADAAIAMQEKRYEVAAGRLRNVVARSEPDAGLYRDLGWAFRQSGCWRGALGSWCRSLPLDWNDDIAWEIDRLRAELGPYAKTHARRAFAGDDERTRVGLSLRTPLADERWSIALDVAWARFEGPAAAVGGTVSDAIGIVTLSARRRFARRHHIEAGATLMADREAGRVVAPFASVRLETIEPFAYVQLEAFANRLLEDPAGAVALGGRRSGVRVEGWQDIGPRWFVSGSLAYEDLALDLPGVSDPSDGFVSWRASVGRRIWLAPCALSARLDYTGSRLLDDRALAGSIPLGERFDFMTGALALERRIGTRWDAQIEAYAGADLAGPDLLGGIEAALRLRLQRGVRLRFAAGYGSQARYQDGDSGHLDVELELFR
ncbi:MAG: tetratricopeptide repeat protein [Planctomycetota bacterium]|nr:tetratricopeptide repeat protein [Planctomycetota bacterium]